ncbi:hypothetical protein ACFFGH_23710 [Lysobacter korlensis]|uniref:Uncharacterized protein n=1 Tax=Lysobacter korlensis TaxID=553636 RepID=A0ABV6RV43_9GAMM
MSMSEPLLPHPHADSDRTAAAEPGAGGPESSAPEEPDVLPETADAAEPQPGLPAETPFRTPVPGERLHPDDLADDDREATAG